MSPGGPSAPMSASGLKAAFVLAARHVAEVPIAEVSKPTALPLETEIHPRPTSQQAPVEPAPNQAALGRDVMREVQARLRSFGFNSGPVDETGGPMTDGAVMHYQQDRGQPQTGKVDSQLLEQLRQDPAPQIAQRAARPDARATRSPGPQRSDHFEPVRVAGNRLGQWLESRTR
jgi:peptidoglycan hydrolase-like protein with peptidoglycan-binding domain